MVNGGKLGKIAGINSGGEERTTKKVAQGERPFLLNWDMFGELFRKEKIGSVPRPLDVKQIIVIMTQVIYN